MIFIFIANLNQIIFKSHKKTTENGKHYCVNVTWLLQFECYGNNNNFNVTYGTLNDIEQKFKCESNMSWCCKEARKWHHQLEKKQQQQQNAMKYLSFQ